LAEISRRIVRLVPFDESGADVIRLIGPKEWKPASNFKAAGADRMTAQWLADMQQGRGMRISSIRSGSQLPDERSASSRSQRTGSRDPASGGTSFDHVLSANDIDIPEMRPLVTRH